MDNFLSTIVVIALTINCILYFKSFFNNEKAFKIFSFYLAMCLFTEFMLRVLIYLKHQNLIMTHFYFIMQFLLLSYFYHELLNNKLKKRLIRYYAVFMIVVLIFRFVLFPEFLMQFDLFEIFFTCFPIIIYAILYFYQMLESKKKFYLVNIGLTIYLFGSTIIFLTGNIINIYSPKFARTCWRFNSLLCIFYHVMVFIEWKKNYSKIRANESKL